MSNYSRLEDDGSAQVIAVDLEENQALWVRVGPVYHHPVLPDGKPGIWIEYQERYMDSTLSGSVLLSIETWRELCAAVEARLPQEPKRKVSDSLKLDAFLAELEDSYGPVDPVLLAEARTLFSSTHTGKGDSNETVQE